MNKTIASYVAIGFAIGALVGLPTALVFQPTKTVTKTKTVQTVIKNGEPTQQMIKSFGHPAQVTSAPQKITIPAGCAVFEGPVSNGSPKWIVVSCAFGN